MLENNGLEVFLALVKAGLWEQDISLSKYINPDYDQVFLLAEEQSVHGLVMAGIEHTRDARVPQEVTLQFIGQSLQIENHNQAMNQFVADIVDKMRNEGIYSLLVKGQGLAQCYERPLWRVCGDVDLLLSKDNYQKAVEFLRPVASKVFGDNPYNKHLAMTIDSWTVELHGTLRGLLKKKIDKGIDRAQNDVFYGGKVRSWMNGKVQVFMPHADEDVVFVFCHLLQHFFKEAIWLRQICDWCRLLWTFRDSLDRELLEMRIRKMGIMTEWKAFASIAVKYLGMPKETMPMYSSSSYWSRKGERLFNYIIKSGHNADPGDYSNSSYVISKAMSFWRHTKVGFDHLVLFPLDTMIVWGNMVKYGIKVVLRKE